MTIDDTIQPGNYQRALLERVKPDDASRVIKAYNLFLQQSRTTQLTALGIPSLKDIMRQDGGVYDWHMSRRYQTAIDWTEDYVQEDLIPDPLAYQRREYWLDGLEEWKKAQGRRW